MEFTPNPYTLFALCPLIFLAGFIDSIAGGGGLISLTSYTAFGLPGAYALGTNKFSSVIGCTAASANYIRTKNYDLTTLIPAVIAALAGSAAGSRCALLISDNVFRILLLIATPLIGILTLAEKDYDRFRRDMKPAPAVAIAFAIGLVIGFYDGFYGPGAGTFFQLGFVMLAGLEIKKACGNSRIVNLSSNLAALVTFIINQRVVYLFAVPCAAFSILGNVIGSRLAIKKDVKIVKPMMLVVIALLIIKLAVDLF